METHTIRCQSKKRRMIVHLTQPVVAHYRVPFFNMLADLPDVELRVYAARRDLGADSIQSIEDLPYSDLGHSWVAIAPRGVLLWQRGLGKIPLGRTGDVLVVSGNLRCLPNYLLMLRAARTGMGLVWWSHGISRHSKPLAQRLRMAVMGAVDAVLLYTEEEVSLYRERGLSPEKLFATNNTVDERPIRKAIEAWPSDRLAAFQREQGIEGDNLFLFCGRLKPLAHLDLALWALRKLVRRGIHGELAVIGDGSEHQRLCKMAADLGVAQRVRWLGGIYDQMLLAPWFLSARALVHPGPIGLSLLHAMNYGLPVITHGNRVNHMPEISALEEGRNGLVFAEYNPTDLADKIALVLADPSLRQELSQGALATVTKQYCLQRMVDGFMDAVRYASERAFDRCHR